ncbi:MAG: MBL fold metallo-hydrolase, partial [Lachnospiraceae bacterium]|nr:MBL fold metallo-hydrolase [Lachnospiraceae bacterium]
DTDYAGTFRMFCMVLKENGLQIKDISYVLATHYHPDHIGLVSELAESGVRLLLADVQRDYIHFSDRIFARDGIPCRPIDETSSRIISCADSRAFLAGLGISGEIIHTPSHSPDSVSLILDAGDCFVGDLEQLEYLEAYENNAPLEKDWKQLLSFRPKRIFYAHAPEKLLG